MAYCLNNQSEVPPACSDGVIVVTQAEYLDRNPFALDIASAQTIGVAIMGVWAVAFGLREIRRMLSGWAGHDNQE